MRERDKGRNYTRKKEAYSPEMNITWEVLSSRELQCVYWAIRGFENLEIAEKLCIEGPTVERHIGEVYSKTNMSLMAGSKVRKLLWFANRDNMIEHLSEDGKLSKEYLASVHLEQYVISEYQTVIVELQEANDELRKANEELQQKLELIGININRNTPGIYSSLNLSSKELEIAKLIRDGLSNVEIAIKLNSSVSHISYVCKSLKEKIGITDQNMAGRIKLAFELRKHELGSREEIVLGSILTDKLLDVIDKVGT